MKNIISYVLDFGDRSFEECEFNEVDSLLLSQLSYLHYDTIFPSDTNNQDAFDKSCCRKLHDLLEFSKKDFLYQDLLQRKLNQQLLTAAAKSRRYGDVRLFHYISEIDIVSEKQFSAITFWLEDQFTHVTFRGTDATLVGWKEDFNMAFISPVPAQIDALHYLNFVAGAFTGPLLIGGHSKGGNLAVYSAISCESLIQERITAVYSHDGPGFAGDVFESLGYLAVKDRIYKYVPQSSIVGMILEHQEAGIVVESRQLGILQHDPFSWIVEHGAFRTISSIRNSALLMDNALNQWVDSMSEVQRELFVNTLFHVLSSSEATTLIELLLSNPRQNALAMFEAAKGIDKESKDFCLKAVTTLLTVMNKTFIDFRLERFLRKKMILQDSITKRIQTHQEKSSN